MAWDPEEHVSLYAATHPGEYFTEVFMWLKHGGGYLGGWTGPASAAVAIRGGIGGGCMGRCEMVVIVSNANSGPEFEGP